MHEISSAPYFFYVKTIFEGVAFDGADAVDEVLEVGAEVCDGGFEFGAGFGKLGGGRRGGGGADAKVGGEEGAGGF